MGLCEIKLYIHKSHTIIEPKREVLSEPYIEGCMDSIKKKDRSSKKRIE